MAPKEETVESITKGFQAVFYIRLLSLSLLTVLKMGVQWEFQDPKFKVPTMYKAYIRAM